MATTTKPRTKKADGTGKSSSSASAKRGRPSSKPSIGREIWLIAWGIIGILFGLLFFVLCTGFWYGSGEIVKIIAEINERDFSVMSKREVLYEEFFLERDDQGYRITKEEKKIFSGVVSYMWRVKPPGSSEIREFGWNHDLESNTVQQSTNGALLLDLMLEIISEEYARTLDMKGDKERFNPDDSIAYGIVHGDQGQISLGTLDGGWDDSLPTRNGVIPPVISHEAANNRQAEQQKALAPDEETGEAEEVVEPTEETDAPDTPVDVTPVGAE